MAPESKVCHAQRSEHSENHAVQNTSERISHYLLYEAKDHEASETRELYAARDHKASEILDAYEARGKETSEEKTLYEANEARSF
jgi:hypothetical protein